MGVKAGANGVVKEASAGKVGVSGVVREVKEGWCGVNGVCRKVAIDQYVDGYKILESRDNMEVNSVGFSGYDVDPTLYIRFVPCLGPVFYVMVEDLPLNHAYPLIGLSPEFAEIVGEYNQDVMCGFYESNKEIFIYKEDVNDLMNRYFNQIQLVRG